MSPMGPPPGLLPGNCVNDIFKPSTDSTCTFYHSDAFLYDATAQKTRSIMLMDAHPTAPTAYSAINTERFRTMFRKLSSPHPPQTNNTTLNILVFGGSFTTGLHLGKNESWTYRLEKLLRLRYPHHRINIFNRGVGATSSIWALNTLHTVFSQLVDPGGGGANVPTVDLVVVDYDVNDCAMSYTNMASFTDFTQSVTEVFIRRVLGHATAPAVMYLNIATSHADGAAMRARCSLYDACYLIGEKRLPVLRQYGVPIVSQQTALWFNFSCPPPMQIWTCKWSCQHPLAPSYDIVAHLMLSFLSGESAAHSTFARALLMPDAAATAGTHSA